MDKLLLPPVGDQDNQIMGFTGRVNLIHLKGHHRFEVKSVAFSSRWTRQLSLRVAEIKTVKLWNIRRKITLTP